ncbi:hypothetical protein [Methanoplanus limicola]|uniref:Uncharacterized protein n=1 Tax=Methanoplanus limicola DSM 2279 TaxID=937775 RepID=H1YYL9_9EURY|nr:hypothetical protein [Methanoplanus limicola]EHQ36002.1 hypothetical protein Metlim_1903 [Methanoplanus limicola DSM 2279]
MKILTERKCNLLEYYIEMEIGWEKNRGDVIAYAKLAKENNNRISSDVIKSKFLGPCPPAVPESVLNYCIKNHIFEWEIPGETAILTDNGLQCAENEKYYELKRDIYHIVLPDEPDIPVKILECEPVSHSDNRINGEPELTTLPENISSSIEGCKFEVARKKRDINEYRTIYENGKIFEINNNCIILESKRETKISGYIDGNSNLTEYFSDNDNCKWERGNINCITLNQKLKEIYPDVFGWDDRLNGIKTSFPVNDNIRDLNKFNGNIFFKNMKLNEFFGDSPINIEYLNCRLIPKSLDDAQRWYIFNIEQDIHDYISEEGLDLVKLKNKSLFEEYDEFYSQIRIPDRKELIESVHGKDGLFSRKFWYLQAPIDLSMENII